MEKNNNYPLKDFDVPYEEETHLSIVFPTIM